MFRLSRIKNVQITGQHFTPREIQEHEKQVTHAPLVDLKLRFNEKVLHRVYDTFDGDCISKNDDGSFDLTVSFPEEEWIYGYVLSFGGNAEVIEPEHIREIIKARAKEILIKY